MSDDAIRDELLALGAATLHEALGQRGWLGPSIVPAWPGARLAGRCRTVWIPPGDNLGVHLALERADAGELLCVATDGPWAYGAWGEVLMRAARAAGVVGLVTSTGVRDVEQLAAAGFPVFARGRAIQGTTKREPGRQQVPVVLGAVLVNPGDWIVADADGAVVVPAGQLDAALAAARERVAKEDAAMARIDAGATTREALGIA
jgi:4-hydroxy-4-methyl-2-oxoglutarate aldolase